jgi:galactokinase
MKKEIFVPGRLCLLGEHSDWAGGHRRQNSELGIGYTIVAPTNQGIYATVEKLNEPRIRFISEPLGSSLDMELKEEELLRVAQEGGLFSYVAGVAYQFVTNYHNPNKEGIEIINYKMDLPLKKGLSSSASVCVLIAKAFNELFDLKWTNKRIMDMAYLGEVTTPSRCGRMDQVCAYNTPVLMTFDADLLDVKELKIGGDIYFLIVDLNKGKDTKKILADLNKGFPFPIDEQEKRKHEYFKEINPLMIQKAKAVLEMGDSFLLGKIMSAAQEEFDIHLAPSCPEELAAPKLHEVLNLPDVKKYAYGGKGVGSGGDGTAQLVCKTKEDRAKLKEELEKWGLGCLDLDLRKNI